MHFRPTAARRVDLRGLAVALAASQPLAHDGAGLGCGDARGDGLVRVDGVGHDLALGDGQVGGAVGERRAHHGRAGQDQAASEDVVGADRIDGGGGAEAGQQEGRVRAGQARQHAQERSPAVRAQLRGHAVAVDESQGAGL
ncbi:hypothetical protein G6F22_017394 [Rhizopus arrhizus]|nr:hypothetical protein G6F22_017394 [Rhizopus arrhizus]KAG0923554.1 hypothetical protein G6F31_019460 [Rhizopus arrhizus]